jgi:hypothetical protein
MKFHSLFFLFVCLQMSCQRLIGSSSYQVPASVASVDDQAEIDKTVTEIQGYADHLGIDKNFHDFQVVVVESAPTSENAAAYCQFNDDGGGTYIGILKSTMKSYQSHFRSTTGNSLLYLILVHEFGHCLFLRGHDDQAISIPGLNVFFQKAEKSPEYVSVGGKVSVSAMAKWMSPSGFFLPSGVKSYYLAEVAGLKRWQTREDLESTEGVRLRPASEP